MTDGDVIANNCRQPVGRTVNDRSILDVGPSSNRDFLDVAAQDTVEPNGRLFADRHVPDESCASSHESAGVD
jgi:hypothetical protein